MSDLHPFGGPMHPLDALVGGVVQLIAAEHFQAIAEGANLSQRLLEIVRGDVGELLELAIRPLELGGVSRLFLFGLLSAADVADEEGQHGGALLAADGHGHFGGEGLAVSASRGDLHPPAQQGTFAYVQVAVDAVLLAGADGGRKEHLRRLGAQNLLARMAEDLLRRPVELGDNPLVVDRNDRVERRFENGPFPRLGFGQRGAQAALFVGRAVENHQAGGPAALVRPDAEHFCLGVDELARPPIAEAAAALPAADFVDGGPGGVAQLGPRLLGVEFAQIDRRGRLIFAQADQPPTGGNSGRKVPRASWPGKRTRAPPRPARVPRRRDWLRRFPTNRS